MVTKRVENNTYFILLTILLLLSCGRSNQGLIMQNSKRIIDCNIDDAIKQTVLSSVCDSIRVVPLEDKHLIGFIDIIHTDDSGIYLTSNDILYAFDWKGKERFCVDRRGRASFDYLDIEDFMVSEKYLVIVDSESKKVLLFDKSDGQFIKTVNLDFYPERIAFVDESTLIVSCGGVEGPMLVTFDIDNEVVIDRFLHFEKLFSAPMLQTFTSMEGNPLYKIPFYNDYYTVTKDNGLEKTLSFDFKEKNFNVKGLKNINYLGVNMLVDSKGSADIRNMYNANSMFAIRFKCLSISEDAQYLMLVDTLTNNKYLFDSESYKDDVLFYDHVILPLFYDCYQDFFVSVLYPDLWTETFNSLPEKSRMNTNYKKALDYYQIITETKNPSIVLYHFKDQL